MLKGYTDTKLKQKKKKEAAMPLLCTTYSYSAIVKTLKFNLMVVIVRV